MNVRIYFIALLLTTANCFSQQNTRTDTTEVTDIAKLTLLRTGIGFEKRVGRFQSVYVHGFLNTLVTLGYSGNLGNTSSFSVDPALSLQYRYYYNAAQRQAKGRRTAMNSMNYIGPVFQTAFSRNRIATWHLAEDHRRTINKVAFVWGMQRNYKSRFSLDLSAGAGCLFSTATVVNYAGEPVHKHVQQFTTVGEVSLGFWLNTGK
jgi:hypothetical protein